MGNPTAFYSAVASLIPILLIAGIVEQQAFFRRLTEDRFPAQTVRLFLISFLVFFVMGATGEYNALRALLHGPTDGTEAWVRATLLLMGGLLGFWVAFPLLVALEQKGAKNAVVIGGVVTAVTTTGLMVLPAVH